MLSVLLRIKSYPLDLTHADVIVAPVVKPGGSRARMPGHALRDLDAPAIRHVIRNPSGAGPRGVCRRGGQHDAVYPVQGVPVGYTALVQIRSDARWEYVISTNLPPTEKKSMDSYASAEMAVNALSRDLPGLIA
jgi:hypothetical protein